MGANTYTFVFSENADNEWQGVFESTCLTNFGL